MALGTRCAQRCHRNPVAVDRRWLPIAEPSTPGQPSATNEVRYVVPNWWPQACDAAENTKQ
jgi:hypothetical protein